MIAAGTGRAGSATRAGPMITAAVSAVHSRDDAVACCAGLALAELGPDPVAVVLVGGASPRPALLASARARELEAAIANAAIDGVDVASRGHLCVASAPGAAEAAGLVEHLGNLSAAVVVSVEPAGLGQWRRRLSLIHAGLPADRDLLALLAESIGTDGGKLRVDKRGPGRIGARRALAGLPPGRAPSARYRWLCRGL